jgi:hypothetical protein
MPYLSQDENTNRELLGYNHKQKIIFTFKNIYLPGSNQKNVKEIDSTKGFVKYSMKFSEDFHKIKPKVEQQLFLIKRTHSNQLCYHSIPSGNFCRD